ncbi:putative zinc protease [Oceanicola granulosus HTCC2516]|uniref:Putative zinc protease n=1 Tax=Oceanicola granulosus (strain ATCC BAA-861 / DSM 15982 / KCTC 12143 / HTCC2516) TaxID=314256 RepID=Q2CKE7_OCEGH|nr:pitrilysin family protein [Oceanicola granulosus]EAR52842.1 putative zinc protease [Oceanicola granulosus HTCC2516]
MIRTLFTGLAVGCAFAWSAPAHADIDVQAVTSPGGIEAWLVESHEIPFVAVEILFRGGASLDEPDKRGAVNLMTGLLEEGAGDMTAQEFQIAREGLAAEFGFRAFDDSIAVSARFLTENRDEAVDLLNLALADPTFEDDAVERVRAQVLSNIRASAQDPNDIASATFMEMAFPDHPYGSDHSGTLDSVAALTRDDLVTAHENVLVTGRAHVGVVGDITPEELGPLLDDLFAGLPAEGPPLPPEVAPAIEGGVTVVDFPSPQSVALFGHEGIDRDDEDYFAAYILNEILGGSGRQSLLMEEVREQRGLTYGIGSYLVPKDLADLYLGSVSSANATIAEAIDVTRDIWRDLAENGVSEEDLESAKVYITGAYPLRFDGNGQIADILVGMQFTGLPIDYIETRNDRINAVTLEEINRVAAELLKPEDLHFVVVGQPENLPPAEEAPSQ